MRASRFLQTVTAASVVVFTAAAFSIPVQANEFYQVIDVQADDSLNIRNGAGTQNQIIGSIPANGRTILTTGNTEQIGSSTWVEIVWLGQIGWVNDRFLAQGSAAQNNDPVDINYQQQTPVANGNSHTHPANRCTRSITHTHPSRSGDHKHRYSCQPNQMAPKQTQQPAAPVATGNAHTHPANRCTRSITHTHPSRTRDHSHRYSCQPNQTQNTGQGHTHPANRCTRSITHTHPNGARNHSHRYSCKNNQVQNNAQGHTHPANRCTNSITHAHPNGSGTHNHRYACQPQQMARPKYNQ